MKKWAVPLAVLGLGSVGALAFTRRGRRALWWALDHLEEAPERIAEWNEAAQRELDNIQSALDAVAESLHQPKTVR